MEGTAAKAAKRALWEDHVHMENTAAKAHMSAGIVSWGVQLKMQTFLVDAAELAINLLNSTADAAEIMDRKLVKTIWICMAMPVRSLEKVWLRDGALLVRILKIPH